MKQLLYITFCVLVACSELKEKYTYQMPTSMKDGWQTGSLSSLGIDMARHTRFFDSLPAPKKHNLHSFLLIKHNKLVLEEYFGEEDALVSHDLRSATKSITALLVGIAVDKGYIKSIDEPVSTYLKGYWSAKSKDARKDSLSIRHLLTMSSGLACNDWNSTSQGNEEKMYQTQDWLSFMANLPMHTLPGKESHYCTGGVVLLGEIISQASGMRVDQFARQHLFEPLGIKSAKWSYFKDDQKVDTGGHLYLTSRDFGKIGQLVLQQGKWEQQQLVSTDWIRLATQEQVRLADKFAYGFLWWKHSFNISQTQWQATCAQGNGGQFLFVFPDLQLVAVFTGGNYNSPKTDMPFEIVSKLVLPSQPETNR
jgi:CubicO group peptidase (beta-lactamase class C family)